MDPLSRHRSGGFNIGRKLLAGYAVLAVLTIITAAAALGYLQKLNRVNHSILSEDIPLKEGCESLVETIYSQELYGERHRISRNPKMLQLFQLNRDEFITKLGHIAPLISSAAGDVDQIRTLHETYSREYMRWFSDEEREEASKSREKRLQGLQEQMVSSLARLQQHANQAQLDKTRTASRLASRAFHIIVILSLLSIFLGIGASFLITRNISRAIYRLMVSTKKIARGEFDNLPVIRNKDELGELGTAFRRMASRLQQLEEMNLDANPLTHLPGAVAVEKVLKSRLRSQKKFAFCLIDIDHFKAYNDYYGYARGNRVIVLTSQLIKQAVGKHGDDNCFIGHIGGDDFVLISGLRHFRAICENILQNFDKSIRDMYDAEDRKRGYIETKARTKRLRKFPIMTLSIAVVTNRHRTFDHHIQVSEVAAEIKNFVKSKPESLYMVDRRTHKV